MSGAWDFWIDRGGTFTDVVARRPDGTLATRLGHELIQRGIFVLPGAKMYLSLAHSDEDLATTLGAFEDALRVTR